MGFMTAKELVRKLFDDSPGPRATTSYYLATAVAGRVKAVAAERGITASEAAERLIRLGLECYDEVGAAPSGGRKAVNRPPRRRRRHPRAES